MKSKKALILAISVVTIIAITVGASFAVWDTYSAMENFEIKIGKNVDITLAVTRYNDSETVSDRAYYDADGNVVSEKGEAPYQKLVGSSAMNVPGSNQLRTMLIADFTITENNDWTIGTQIGLKYTVESLGLKNLSQDKFTDTIKNAITVEVYAESDVVGLNDGYRCMAQPVDGAIPVEVNKIGLIEDVKYYVFLKIDDTGFKTAEEAKVIFNDTIQVALKIEADVITA